MKQQLHAKQFEIVSVVVQLLRAQTTLQVHSSQTAAVFSEGTHGKCSVQIARNFNAVVPVQYRGTAFFRLGNKYQDVTTDSWRLHSLIGFDSKIAAMMM